MPLLLLYMAMLIIKCYRVEIAGNGIKTVSSRETPLCPLCGVLMSGYDKRKRTVICDDGSREVYLLRRYRCPQCKRLHLAIPDCIEPQKHYAAETIAATIAGVISHCPADNSTIRRWKKK